MRKVVLTGVTGIIGIHLVEKLLESNIEILAIIRRNSLKKNLLPQSDKMQIIECNLNEFKDLNVKENMYDTFYHLAWEGTRGEDRNNVAMQEKNIKYTIDALKLACKFGCKRFVGIGSQAEYGRIEGKMNPNSYANPDTAYGIAKLCSNKFTNILANQMNIEHIWTRILSAYGPHDDEKTMVMSSIKEMIENGKSPEYTKAEQMWDYIHAKDVARALYLIGDRGKNNSIYCIGSGYTQPLSQYIREIRNQINPNIKLLFGKKEYSKNQVMNLCADITNLTQDTGFIPEINFTDGIKDTIRWYKGERNEKN